MPVRGRSRCSRLAALTQNNKDGLIDALQIFGSKISNAVSELIFWHCCDFINHESRESIEAVAFVGNRNAKQRRFGWISGNDADCDGLGGIEAIILQNGRRPRLAGVILCPRRPSIFLHASIRHPVAVRLRR